MSTVQEFEQAAERLSRADLIHLRAWLDDKIEDDLVVRDEVVFIIRILHHAVDTNRALKGPSGNPKLTVRNAHD